MRGFARIIANLILFAGVTAAALFGVASVVASQPLGILIGFCLALAAAFCSAVLQLLISIDERLEAVNSKTLEV